MEKQKRWQFYLILAVVLLTLFNIMPTVFYYTKPLKEEITETRAETVAQEIAARVNRLEQDSKAWLLSFSKNLGLSPISIDSKNENPGILVVSFKNANEAKLFKRFLPNAGSLIPFIPAQLSLENGNQEDEKTVAVMRQIHVQLKPEEASQLFHYYPKMVNGEISLDFRNTVYDRVKELALNFAGPSHIAEQIKAATDSVDENLDDLVVSIAREISDVSRISGADSAFAERYMASLTQIDQNSGKGLIQKFQSKISSLKQGLEKQKKTVLEAKESSKETQDEVSNEQRLAYLNSQIQALETAEQTLKSKASWIQKAKNPLTPEFVIAKLQTADKLSTSEHSRQFLDFEGRNPLVEGLIVDWGNDRILLKLFPDVEALRQQNVEHEEQALVYETINKLLINDIARVSRLTDESILPNSSEFAIATTNLSNARSFLSLDLGFVAKKQMGQLLSHLESDWKPEHKDLHSNVFPVMEYDQFRKQPVQDQNLGLVVYAPTLSSSEPPLGFKRTSLYVIAKGMDAIIQKYKEAPQAEGKDLLNRDIQTLSDILKQRGFIAYSGSSYGIDKKFHQDYIFELDDYYSMLLNATRENFYIKGSKERAVLDFTDVEQRIITLNQIDDRIQEDLLKWRDEYRAAHVDLDLTKRYEIPAPTKNALWENIKLSAVKYFRGDDRKILRWGLDLSGGKTVRIGLRDQNNKVVTNPEDLKQAVNELYVRINKMGVAERTIRVENNNIILDFPGSQGFSANDLIQASAMYFHIVNEKFSPSNSSLQSAVNQYLQDIWNEAVVTNRKDTQSINQIAWEHLGSDEQTAPRSESAKILYENGLRLADPRGSNKSAAFDDTLSSIAVMQGDDFTEWDGQASPLLIVFHNYALEGSSLSNVQIGYDPTEGYILNFSVKSAYDNAQKGLSNPREDFYAWTSHFAEDKISGTVRETYSRGRGWRMAVILNQKVITKPSLRAALKDAASISGRFTQREISQLASDLKAGSLSFTPTILSEQNVSAELGKEEKMKGFVSSFLGLVLVAIAMISFYRFAGLVATCAVLFNLFIMWGVLQNLGAALTLPGIAGIVLTIGMAVDANVLVFERTREEFEISGRIASALQAGYRKAFSAIVDSNVTTIIAALILIQFDSGPIKGFAITLIVGLISSMFTALFMTRFFFAGWVQRSKNKTLKMSEWIKNSKIDFLSYTKAAVCASLIVTMLGCFVFYNQRNSLFGMDFTGGYSLTVELDRTRGENINYRESVSQALIAHGASSRDFEVRELDKPNVLRLQLSLGMEQEGHPFHALPLTDNLASAEYSYQTDPRIVWVVNALNDAGLKIQPSELPNLANQWSMMSSQFSSSMRNNALIALGLALLSILLYITFRFEFNYAVSAVIALGHDIVITLGVLALFHKLGFPVQIDLQVIGAVMTLIGYSLNDTIIVFDRVREDHKLLRKLAFKDVINHALNVTLGRTLMTSGTTLLVLLPLVLIGGSSIFAFSLVMTVGVFVGTFSSLFIACPALLYFQSRDQKRLERNLKGA